MGTPMNYALRTMGRLFGCYTLVILFDTSSSVVFSDVVRLNYRFLCVHSEVVWIES